MINYNGTCYTLKKLNIRKGEKMTEKSRIIPQKNAEWKPIHPFGKGTIYANGDERKIVTPGFPNFKYRVKPELVQQTKSSSILS